MRKLILALAALATLGATGAASAQDYRDRGRDRVREDRREYREERREYRDARRYGDRGDIREERREFRDAARDLRRSEYYTGRYGRDGYPGRGYRDRGYGRDYYGYDRGYGYGYDRRDRNYGYGYGGRPYWRDWRIGYRVPRGYFGPRYYIDDYRAYRLYGPPRGYRWHRYGQDAFLLGYDGRVGDLRLNLFLGG